MGQRQTSLLSEVRHRSKSFTEGNPGSAEQQDSLPPPPPAPSHHPSPPPGWSSSPVTPRGDCRHDDDSDDVIEPTRHPAGQRDVYIPGEEEISLQSVSSIARHPRQREVAGNGVSERHVTSHVDDVISDSGVTRSGGYIGDSAAGSADSGHFSGFDERRVQVNVEQHSRTYSAAWDEYDSEEEANKFETTPINSARESSRSAENADESTWITTNPGKTTLESGRTQTEEAAEARSSTIPRHRPPTLYSAHSHSNVSAPGQSVDPVSDHSKAEDHLARFSSSETLGRHPRGPILKYLQRTREADTSPSVSPGAFSLDSPREKAFIFPGEFPPQSSSTETTEQSSKASPSEQRSGLSDEAQSSTDASTKSVVAKKPTQLPTSLPKPSTGIPQPAKKSSSIPQRSRSTSQGPGPRKSPASAGPVSGAAGQSPRAVISSGIPVRPRSSSTGQNYSSNNSNNNSSRKPLIAKSVVEGSGIGGGGGGGGGARVKREGEGEGEGQGQPMAVVEVAARDLRSPVMHGFLCRKTFTDHWVRYWYVLQEESLYCYLTPDDDVTIDVTDLDGYSVASLEDKFPGQRFVLHLEHKDYISVYLSTASREEMEEWYSALTSAIKIIAPVNGLHPSQQQEEGEGAGREAGEDRALGIKQKLLAEVLRQTQELEKKQAARMAHKKQHSLEEQDPHPHSPPSTPPPPSSTPAPTGEQICHLTRLRQRRMSTQIKMDTLQRQIQNNGQQMKKSRFTFGKKKCVDEAATPHNPDLVRQLKTLSDHLSEIDRDLMQNGGVMSLDRKTTMSSSSILGTRGRKLMISRHSQDLESSFVEGGGGGGGGGRRSGAGGGGVEGSQEDNGSIGRSNSLKSSVQKLAHRTFAKAGWSRGGKKAYSLDRDDHPEDKPEDLHHHYSHHHHHHNNNNDSPDVIDLSHRLMRTWPARDASQESEDGELFLPPPISFDSGGLGGMDDTSLPPSSSSPVVSSPRSARSVESAESRSGSLRRSEGSRLHGRRQVDPHAVANIEAFEEMSREILGEPT